MHPDVVVPTRAATGVESIIDILAARRIDAADQQALKSTLFFHPGSDRFSGTPLGPSFGKKCKLVLGGECRGVQVVDIISPDPLDNPNNTCSLLRLPPTLAPYDFSASLIKALRPCSVSTASAFSASGLSFRVGSHGQYSCWRAASVDLEEGSGQQPDRHVWSG